ncbi:hypothetical protein IscW_ISCW015375 [Ixodes scapularis]|uniref:Uncharacterized protein n=1 Tax=Ixodes scapularis TaxID=6945 RepID=B7QMU6_IXOSC|nr:hypothetical protein IscW_ISCW015375 [Ixodes scapularis]|eukprot:XP_002400284.1 hypothetical protein IscW_ISCW015375 [Ixodes scapularis]
MIEVRCERGYTAILRSQPPLRLDESIPHPGNLSDIVTLAPLPCLPSSLEEVLFPPV